MKRFSIYKNDLKLLLICVAAACALLIILRVFTRDGAYVRIDISAGDSGEVESYEYPLSEEAYVVIIIGEASDAISCVSYDAMPDIEALLDGVYTDESIIGTDGVSDVEYNLLQIADGKANMLAASCPDLICVHSRAIHKSSETIVCLPHGVTVSVVGEGTADPMGADDDGAFSDTTDAVTW